MFLRKIEIKVNFYRISKKKITQKNEVKNTHLKSPMYPHTNYNKAIL